MIGLLPADTSVRLQWNQFVNLGFSTMPEFVKICPRCGRANPEYENLCADCQQFIGMEPAVPRPTDGGQRGAEPDSVDATAGRPPPEAPLQTAQPTEPQGLPQAPAAPPTFYLSLNGEDRTFTLQDGSVMGQAYPGSPATVQIPAGVNGVEYVHRQHCRFEYRDARWRVQPLDQAPFNQTFTNPTRVNRHLVPPGTWHLLADGDELRLSGVSFHIKII